MIIKILTHKCFWGKIHLFDFEMKKGRGKEWAKTVIEKFYRKDYFNPETAKGELHFVEIPPPDTFPKFSNEINFKIKWNNGYIHNPKIKAIRWCNGWEYQLENIGHLTDFQSENKLEKI